MNTVLLSLLCVLLFVCLGVSEARKELPPSIYIDIEKNDPAVKDLVDFAIGEMGNTLVSVGRVAKKTLSDGSLMYKMILEVEDSSNRRRNCVAIISTKNDNQGRELVNQFCSGYH